MIEFMDVALVVVGKLMLICFLLMASVALIMPLIMFFVYIFQEFREMYRDIYKK